MLNLPPMDDETRKKMMDAMLEAMKTPITPFRYIHHYAEPCQVETDEEGNIYGYKVLIWNAGKMMFMSPVYPAYWGRDGELTADKNPARTESHGIYFLKSGGDPELVGYYRHSEYQSMQYGSTSKVFTVRCMLFGTIVEAERGFRVEHAKIEGVLDNHGHWQTYQDFRAEAEAYYRR